LERFRVGRDTRFDAEAEESGQAEQLRENPVASWALRIGEFRVFYDVSVDEEMVSVRAVGRKDRNFLFIRGMRIAL